jgi:N utilization substance protein A
MKKVKDEELKELQEEVAPKTKKKKEPKDKKDKNVLKAAKPAEVISPKEIIETAEVFANEKGIPVDAIIHGIEEAIAHITKKDLNIESNIRVSMDKKTGEYKTYRIYDVVSAEDYNDRNSQMIIDFALEEGYKTKVGEQIEIEIPSIQYNRSFVQTARTVLTSKLKEWEKNQVLSGFEKSINKIFGGKIKKRLKEAYIVDLFPNNVEAILPFNELIGHETFQSGTYVQAILKEINREKSLSLVLSRKSDNYLLALFKREIPEIAEGFITIEGVARDPGYRSKVAVSSQDKRIDLRATCIGMGANRIKSIIRELNGEKVDIILYNEDPILYVANAMQPAEIVEIAIDEIKKRMTVAVTDETLPKAIGASNRNVGLASKLTGFDIEVLSELDFQRKQDKEQRAIFMYFRENLDISEKYASLLVDNGFVKLDDIVYTGDDEFLELGFKQKEIDDLKTQARLKQISIRLANAKKEQELQNNDLLDVAGITSAIAQTLIDNQITNREELAEMSIDELTQILDLNSEEAGELIMSARAFWFE